MEYNYGCKLVEHVDQVHSPFDGFALLYILCLVTGSWLSALLSHMACRSVVYISHNQGYISCLTKNHCHVPVNRCFSVSQQGPNCYHPILPIDFEIYIKTYIGYTESRRQHRDNEVTITFHFLLSLYPFSAITQVLF